MNNNILSILKPKAMISYINEETTVRQAVEKMRRHKFTAVPVINSRGEFVKALAEGDFLWFMLQNEIFDLSGLEHYVVSDIPKRVFCEPVSVSSTMGDLFRLSMNQNFVPVTDDRGVFIGIVTRRDILQICYDELQSSGKLDTRPEYERTENGE
ncbi:MAG: CBS domain-containing protein [Ruminococcus sp.]|nr:CBS domain-containing protein [Ruminococcus sp.]